MTPPREVEVEAGGRTYRFTIERASGGDRFRVTHDGVTRVVDARRIGEQTLSLIYVEGGTGSHEAVLVDGAAAGQLDVHLDGAMVSAFVDRARQWRDDTAEGVAAGSQEVVAPMPGKVVRVLVEEGQEVEARQGIVVVEAMKMENEIAAPRAGRIAAVRAREGASVEAGTVLVVIE